MYTDQMPDSATTAAVMEFVSAAFVSDKRSAEALCRLLAAAGIPARLDAEVTGCLRVLVPDDLLETATELLAKKKKDVEEEEGFDEEEEDDDEEDDEEDDDEEFDDDEDFEEEFGEDELDEDEDDIFYDDDDDE